MSGFAKPLAPSLRIAHRLADKLVGAWLFHERGGTFVNDFSPANINGAVSGTSAPSWALGPDGPVMTFGASNSYVALAVNVAPGRVASALGNFAATGTKYSFVAGVRGSSNAAIGITALWACGASIIEARSSGAAGTFRGWSFGFESGKLATARSSGANASGGQRISSTTSVNDNIPHNVAGVVDVNAVSLYIDGNLDATGTFSSTGATGDFAVSNSSNNIYAQIGSRINNALSYANGFNGDINYFYIFSTALTAAEVAALHVDPYALFRRSPPAWISAGISSGAIGGSLVSTLDDATLSSAASLDIQGSLTATLDDATLSATASLDIQGSLTATLDDATLSSAASLDIQGSLTATLDDATLSATASLDIQGSLTATLDDATLSSAASLDIQGSLTATLDDATLEATGGSATGISLDVVLDDATLSATAALDVQADLNSTLDDAALSATAVLDIQGSLDSVLEDATLASTASLEIHGSYDGILDDATLLAEGTLSISAYLDIVLDDATLDSQGSLTTPTDVHIITVRGERLLWPTLQDENISWPSLRSEKIGW